MSQAARRCASPVLVAAIALWASPAGAEPDGRAIMDRVAKNNRAPDETVNATLRAIGADGQAKERRFTMWVLTGKDYEDRTLIRFTAPGTIRGSAFLVHQHGRGEDDLWTYLPALKKVKRLAATERRDPFAGSDFANEDLRTENLLAYDYKLLGKRRLDAGGPECWIVEARPATEGEKRSSGYAARHLWVSADYLVRRVDFIAAGGPANAPAKTLLLGTYQAFKGFHRPDRATMVDHRRKTRTEMIFDAASRTLNGGLGQALFSERGLAQP